MGKLLNLVITMTMISIICVSFNFIFNVNTIGDTFINKVFGGYGTTSTSINSDLDSGFSKTVSQTENGTTGLFAFIDGLKKVFSLLISLLTLGFSLFNLLVQTGAPILICSFIGIPFAITYYLSIVAIVRGFDI